ncbi:CHASE2 domain-containing protein [Alkalinema pantanalense CENA528]|uniref:CHASE2 domain-containing protein n=1 Tax=Alkalinema pantanalense TaxID=1620705 RepID=UPI003D6E5DAD
MAKRVVLRLEGNLEQGFQATLEVGDLNRLPEVEASGSLPAAMALLDSLEHWRSIYRQGAYPTRITLQQITVRMGRLNPLEDCRRAAQALQTQMQQWLASPTFHPIDRQLRESLNLHDSVQVLLRSTDRRLHWLPWHLWDFFERYSQAELAISAMPGRVEASPASAPAPVNILTLLGDRRGLDTTAEQQFLHDLPDTAVTCLVEPSRQQITESLWSQPWDILFFAGHSQTENDQGRIYLNPQESLTIEELKYGLRSAIANGLQLAIFNSCDGLGLAYELDALHLPQLIVLREPVPDTVAQEFVKFFLTAFSQGKSLYLAVREARERLQGLEGQYPCASWLPMIYQNPTAVSLTWQALQQTPRQSLADLPQHSLSLSPIDRRSWLQWPNRQSQILAGWRFCLAPLIVAATILGVRQLGWLQPLEIAALDQLIQLHTNQSPDPRLLVILITDEDVQAQAPRDRRGSLSDATLAQLLQRLNTYQPRVVGLDLYRDFAVSPQYSALAKQLRQTDRWVGVCKVGEAEQQESGVAPPPELPADQIGFSDLVLDADQVVRRHLLSMTPTPSSRCVAPYALSVQLALRYLDTQGISLSFPNPETWQLGSLKFHPIKGPIGGYQNLDDRGYQILLNYRAARSPQGGIRQVTLGQVLRGEVNPAAIRDRIVLIGTIAEGTHDYWLTPYRNPRGEQQSLPGVVLQAQMTSQLVSAALDGRPLIWAWPLWLECLWIVSGVLWGGTLARFIRQPTFLGLALVATIALLLGSCWILFLQLGAWVPLVPEVLGVIMGGMGVRSVEGSTRQTLTPRTQQP